MKKGKQKKNEFMKKGSDYENKQACYTVRVYKTNYKKEKNFL